MNLNVTPYAKLFPLYLGFHDVCVHCWLFQVCFKEILFKENGVSIQRGLMYLISLLPDRVHGVLSKINQSFTNESTLSRWVQRRATQRLPDPPYRSRPNLLVNPSTLFNWEMSVSIAQQLSIVNYSDLFHISSRSFCLMLPFGGCYLIICLLLDRKWHPHDFAKFLCSIFSLITILVLLWLSYGTWKPNSLFTDSYCADMKSQIKMNYKEKAI